MQAQNNRITLNFRKKLRGHFLKLSYLQMRKFGPEKFYDLCNEWIIMSVVFVFCKQNRTKAESWIGSLNNSDQKKLKYPN